MTRILATFVALVALVALALVPWSAPTLVALLALYISAGYAAFNA